MFPLYFILLLGSLIVPAGYSLLQTDFIKNWKPFIISTSVIAGIFLVWDAFFTSLGVWGFNPDYCLGIFLLSMPIEEWLFFFIIPFCSLFIHFARMSISKQRKSNIKATRIFFAILLSFILVVLLYNLDKSYTAVNLSLLLLVMALGIWLTPALLQQFSISFLIILIPFLLVNGILTGLLTTTPVVWYDDSENLGIRLFTIPVEDVGYAFTMLFGNLLLFDYLLKSRE